MKTINTLCLFSLIVAFISCKSPQEKNKIFAKYSPTSKEYRDELNKQFNSKIPQGFIYEFNNYQLIDDKEYISITIKGNNIAAKSLVLVDNWNKIEGIKRTKGIGYRGAGLKNLKLAKITNNPISDFVYQDLESIID